MGWEMHLGKARGKGKEKGKNDDGDDRLVDEGDRNSRDSGRDGVEMMKQDVRVATRA